MLGSGEAPPAAGQRRVRSHELPAVGWAGALALSVGTWAGSPWKLVGTFVTGRSCCQQVAEASAAFLGLFPTHLPIFLLHRDTEAPMAHS